ncbi:MAG: aldehyde dehydrogenase family protein [Deltaproteobacteria bacterium]|nr:aldehyde dehydrogenase family protein [Deltaproteobacteria bacterium]
MSALSPDDVRRVNDRLLSAGQLLRKMPLDVRAAGVARVAAQLRAHGRAAKAGQPDAAVELVAASAGLSVPMTAWAIETTAARYEERGLLALAEPLFARPDVLPVGASLVAVVLAGNVFSVALRAIALPLLVGSPVLVKASSRDPAFADVLVRTFGAVAPELLPAVGVVTYGGGDDALDAALVSRAEVVSVYGGRHAVEAFRTKAPGTARVVAHGHGMSFGLVTHDAFEGELEPICAALALDVAAYDGRGCLSPHAILVPREGRVSPEELARALARHGLEPIGRTLPRGPLVESAQAQQTQWRSVAVARGFLHEGDDFSISVEPSIRLSPGYRNIALVPYGTIADAMSLLASFAIFAKAIGITSAPGFVPAPLVSQLPTGCAPRFVRAGTMQDPPLDALDDGLPALEGLVRYVEIRL